MKYCHPSKKRYSIDSYYHIYLNWPKTQTDVVYYLVQKRLSKWKERSILIHELSHLATKKFKTHELDFVFIGAGHNYDEVKLDLESWYD